MTLHTPTTNFVPHTLAEICARHPDLASAALVDSAEATSLRRLGLALWRDSQLSDAISVLSLAVSLQPSDPRLLSELGAALFAADRKPEAMQALKTSTSLDGRQFQTWLTLACLHQEMEQLEDAEGAYRAALMLDASSAQALAGLGILLALQRRDGEAAPLLASAVACGADDPGVQACLGQGYFALGAFSQSCAAFACAIPALAGHLPVMRKYAEARLVAGLIAGSLPDALRAAAEIVNNDPADMRDVRRQAFQTLCVYGPHEAAQRLGEALLATSPDDTIIRYHMDALSGHVHDRTPDSYLKASFDAFAPKFDHQLVEVLGYRIPEQVRVLLANSGLRFARALDLGCGTGLAAPVLKSIGVGQLVGVDVSPGMLGKARDRRLYDGLHEAEIGAYLNAGHETFDLIVCLDVVIYFGGVAELFADIARRTTPGGIFAFSYETTTRDGHVLQPSGRFAHNPHAIARQIGPEFTPVSRTPTVIRLEAGRPVSGEIVLLRRC